MMANKNKRIEPLTKQYDPSDYNKKGEVSSGLATTHEQVSDTYTEGTIDGKIDHVNGKDEDVSRDGFEK